MLADGQRGKRAVQKRLEEAEAAQAENLAREEERRRDKAVIEQRQVEDRCLYESMRWMWRNPAATLERLRKRGAFTVNGTGSVQVDGKTVKQMTTFEMHVCGYVPSELVYNKFEKD